MWIKRSSARHFGDGVMKQRNIRAQKGKKYIETMYYIQVYITYQLILIAMSYRKCIFDAVRIRVWPDLVRSIIILRWPTTMMPADKRKKKRNICRLNSFVRKLFLFLSLNSPLALPAVTFVFIFNLLYHYIGATCVLIFHSNDSVLPSKHKTPQWPMTTPMYENKYHYNIKI